ncbi:MAG: hypothetical protein AB7P04_12020 [Bacteriovoracia bacterium]
MQMKFLAILALALAFSGCSQVSISGGSGGGTAGGNPLTKDVDLRFDPYSSGAGPLGFSFCVEGVALIESVDEALLVESALAEPAWVNFNSSGTQIARFELRYGFYSGLLLKVNPICGETALSASIKNRRASIETRDELVFSFRGDFEINADSATLDLAHKDMLERFRQANSAKVFQEVSALSGSVVVNRQHGDTPASNVEASGI